MTGSVEDGLFDTEDGREYAEAEPMERADSIEHLVTGEQDQGARLDDATLEPAAQVEATGDYAQAEAIEAALTELVDSAQDDVTEGGKGAFGQEAGDPSQHYSGVQMTQGEVQSDQDWNEDANAPATEEMAVEWTTSGDADDRPTEEIHPLVSQMMAQAILDDAYRDRLVDDTDGALREHGLNREDLPDLSDPEAPQVEAFVRDVQQRVVEGLSYRSRDETQSDLFPQEPSDQERMLMLQLATEEKDSAEQTISSVMTALGNTVRDLIANMK